MTVLTTVQSAASVLGLDIPSVLFSSTTRTWMEMQNMVNFCARQLLEEYDWQRLKKIASVTGDGSTTAFDLPSDYDRMVKDANIWGPSFTFYPSHQVDDVNRWLELETYSVETWTPRWSLFGGYLNLLPAIASGDVMKYFYVSNLIVKSGTTPDQTAFLADTDSFVLDERLLDLCLRYNWKKAKGFDYAAELQDYEEALSRAQFKDTGARQAIISGRGYGRFPSGQMFP
jgi:hypothetical protein